MESLWNCCCWTALVFGISIQSSWAEDLDPIQLHRQQSREDWIDPNNPLGKRPLTVQKVVEVTKSTKILPVAKQKCPASNSNDPFSCPIVMKHLVREFLDHLRPQLKGNYEVDVNYCSSGNLVAELNINPSELKWLAEFISTDRSFDVAEIQDVRLAYQRIFKSVKCEEFGSEVATSKWIGIMVVVNMLIAIPALIILIRQLLRLNFWQLSFLLCFLLFATSCVWTWLHMYKVKQAEMLARLRTDVPSDCLSAVEGVSAWGSVASWTRRLFTLSRTDSLCAQYYKDLMVDPFWEVPPTEAVAVTFSRFFLAPLEHLGEHLGRFWRHLFAELPVYLWPLVTVLVCGGFFVFLVFWRDYNVSLLYGLIRLGPTPQVQSALESRPSRSAPQLPSPPENPREIRSRSRSAGRLAAHQSLSISETVDAHEKSD